MPDRKASTRSASSAQSNTTDTPNITMALRSPLDDPSFSFPLECYDNRIAFLSIKGGIEPATNAPPAPPLSGEMRRFQALEVDVEERVARCVTNSSALIEESRRALGQPAPLTALREPSPDGSRNKSAMHLLRQTAESAQKRREKLEVEVEAMLARHEAIQEGLSDPPESSERRVLAKTVAASSVRTAGPQREFRHNLFKHDVEFKW